MIDIVAICVKNFDETLVLRKPLCNFQEDPIMIKWSNFYLNTCMFNNILMRINFGTGVGLGFYYSPFSVDSVQTHLAIAVALAEFGSVTAFRHSQINSFKSDIIT